MVRGGQRAVGSLESRKFMVYEWLSCVLPCLCVALWSCFLNAGARSRKGFEICFLIYVPVLNYTVEDEEDENS